MAGKLQGLAKHIDMNELVDTVSTMEPAQLKGMMALLKAQKAQNDKPLPAVNGDFYDIASTLTPEQREIQMKVRAFMEKEVAPIANEHWENATFPMHLFKELQNAEIAHAVYDEEGNRRPDASVIEGILTMEMCRVDSSVAVGFGVHTGLAMSSILVGGSDEQRAKWLPPMRNFEKIGAFALTEPAVGSGAAGGLTTTAKRDGDSWTIRGQKKWIGNSPFADVIVVWARDVADQQVKGFIVEKGAPGMSVETIEGKIALRMVQNGLITFDDCRVSEADRLQNVNSFREVATVLKMTRAGVAWQGVGCAMGAYEKALAYAQERKQFGKPIANFQMIQDKLVTMLGYVTAMQTMALRLSHMQDAGKMGDEHASLAKVVCARWCREVVALARETLGGNGILLEHDVARLFADAEAIYSYEGSNEMNTMVVGRAITGFSAFV